MKKLLFVSSLVTVLSLGNVVSAHASLFYVWTDTTNDGVKDLFLGSINGYEGIISGRDNYNYFSFSGHPIFGPFPQSHRLKIFVYERITNGRDFLNIIGGEDFFGHNHRHSFSVDIGILGSALDPHKVRGDEPGEFKETSEDYFEGDWTFRRNSDGGVVGGLFGDWEAKITFNDSSLNRHVFASDGSPNLAIDDYWNNDGYNTYFISRRNTTHHNTAPVPEPITMVLFAGGLVGLTINRRKRN